MRFIHTPLSFESREECFFISRDIDNQIEMLDNLIELIVFSPKGSFNGDPDFGFEYWNHEFSNINNRNFNNEQAELLINGANNEVTKEECLRSVQRSLSTYAPQLRNVIVSMDLNAAEAGKQHKKKVPSKYIITICVEGTIYNGLGDDKYKKEISFFVEPTTKKHRI